MDTKELTRQIEEADYHAVRLAAHMTLFDAYYNDKYGIEQATLDPETFYTSMSDILDKAVTLSAKIQEAVDVAHGKEWNNE